MMHGSRLGAGGAWLLAVMMALVAIMISFTTSAWGQTPPNHPAPCERVPFAAFYAASVEAVPTERLGACLAGTSQPANFVFASWADAPSLLRHLERIDRRLRPGVTRDAIPSPGDVALANARALIARCEPIESEPGDGEHHRTRVRLSHRAMRRYPWDPGAWFPRHKCAGRLSIEIRPADARIVTRVTRPDVLIDATRRLRDGEVTSVAEVQELASTVRARLYDPHDPPALTLYPPFVAELVNWLLRFQAPESQTEEIASLRRQLRAERRESDALRRSVRESVRREESAKELPGWLMAIAAVLFLALVVVITFAWTSINDLQAQMRRFKATRAQALKAEREAGQAEGVRSVFQFVADHGWVELIDSDFPRLVSAAAPAQAGKEVQRYYSEQVIPSLRLAWEKEQDRYFDTLVARHREALAAERAKLASLEEELGRYRAALRLAQTADSAPGTPVTAADWDQAVASVNGTAGGPILPPPPHVPFSDGSSAHEPPLEPVDEGAARLLVEVIFDHLQPDDARRDLLKRADAPLTTIELNAGLRTAFDVLVEWRHSVEIGFRSFETALAELKTEYNGLVRRHAWAMAYLKRSQTPSMPALPRGRIRVKRRRNTLSGYAPPPPSEPPEP